MSKRDPKFLEFDAELLELASSLDARARVLLLKLASDLVNLTDDTFFDDVNEEVLEKRAGANRIIHRTG